MRSGRVLQRSKTPFETTMVACLEKTIEAAAHGKRE
jgi:hypothetical protein